MGDATILRELITENTALLGSGIDVMSAIPEELYRAGHDSALHGGVGRHFRHVIEFYQLVLDAEDGVIDFASRARDPNVERDRAYAREAYERVESGLARLERADPEAGLIVVSEFLDAALQPIRTRSTLARELASLASHTIHHYAIIALLIRLAGVEVPEHFGVAPSTLRFASGERR